MEEELESHYLLPRHPTENDRLNLSTWPIELMNGAAWLSPLIDPRDVLDVGCGTGDWGYRIGRRFREARIVGIDIEEFRDAGAPPNFEFRQANALKGLPFEDASFDFVHQRLMVSAVPISQFAKVVAEIVRVTRPGGWVELVEAAIPMQRVGPATAELVTYFDRLYRSAGLDWEGVIPRRLDRYLTDAGLVNVVARTVEIPMGSWAAELGDPHRRAGEMMTAATRSVLDKMNTPTPETPTRKAEPSTFGKVGLEPERGRELIEMMLAEFNGYKTITPYTTAWGRKPT
jgi:SAM-dependent methyltransferase